MQQEETQISQTGGLYLKNIDKRGFKPILDMIVHPESTIKVLTYSSLKGFMISLNVDKQQSEYNYLSETPPRNFTKPVTDFLLKLAIITKKERNIGRINFPSSSSSSSSIKTRNIYNGFGISMLLDSDEDEDSNGILKYSETIDSFIEEAKIQQKIWYTSLSNNKDQICPSIANFSMFTNKNSRRLLNLLKYKTKDEVLKHILNWIINILENNETDTEIGIITMPLIQKSSTFDTYLNLYENGEIPKNEFLMSIESFLIQTLRLWIDHRIYHADLHMNNSLIYKNDDGEIKCVLIDFGKIVDFNRFISKYKDEDGLTSNFFGLMNKRMDRKIHELNFKLLDKCNVDGHKDVDPLSRIQKIDRIERLYKDVYDFDSMYYKRVYGLIHGNSYDYYKTISSLDSGIKERLFERVYDRLYKMYSIVEKYGENQNVDFFIKNKKRFFFIDANPNYKYYYYSLRGYKRYMKARGTFKKRIGKKNITSKNITRKNKQ